MLLHANLYHLISPAPTWGLIQFISSTGPQLPGVFVEWAVEGWSPGCWEEQGLEDSVAYPHLCHHSYLQVELQRAELQSLREEMQRQKELREQDDLEEALSSALSDREEAVNK